MENCQKHSKLLCSQCRHFDYCDVAKRYDGVCYECDIADCENNPAYKEKKMTNEIKIVIGSWGSYNTCNEHALGSEWLNLANYKNWNEIAATLKKQGFRLDGIDKELFVQDIDGLPSNCENWDYISPKELFETLKESSVLHSEYLYTILCAYLEVRSFHEFAERVERLGDNWNDDIYVYENYDWEDYGRELFENSDRHLDDDLTDYFDFEAYGKSFGLSCAEEYSGGIIEIL